MAKPIAFKPVTVDFKTDLERRLEKAPAEHAAALLATLDILEIAHREGLLDIIHGLIGAKDTVTGKLAEYAKHPEVLDQLSKAMSTTTEEHKREQHPPTLWQLWKRTTSEDSRRGLSFLTLL